MRGKRAKELRAMAQSVSVGKDYINWEDWSPPVFKEADLDGNTYVIKTSKGIPARLGDCTRRLYKRLKQEWKNYA